MIEKGLSSHLDIVVKSWVVGCGDAHRVAFGRNAEYEQIQDRAASRKNSDVISLQL